MRCIRTIATVAFATLGAFAQNRLRVCIRSYVLPSRSRLRKYQRDIVYGAQTRSPNTAEPAAASAAAPAAANAATAFSCGCQPAVKRRTKSRSGECRDSTPAPIATELGELHLNDCYRRVRDSGNTSVTRSRVPELSVSRLRRPETVQSEEYQAVQTTCPRVAQP